MTPIADPTLAPTPAQLMGRIRLDVHRLSMHTFPPEDALALAKGGRRRPVTREPLISELRAAIKPDQGGTEKGRSSGSAAIPFDADAHELYDQLRTDISSMFESATERRPGGTPEQLLVDWLHTFESHFDAGDLSTAQLQRYATRISRMRRRVEDHFAPPRTVEYPICPTCGYTHVDLVDDTGLTRVKCVLATAWPDNPRRIPYAECRNCGARWIGKRGTFTPEGVYIPGADDLDEAIRDSITTYGPVIGEISIAGPIDRRELIHHLAPPTGARTTPCCDRTPGELPTNDRITSSPALANCTGTD